MAPKLFNTTLFTEQSLRSGSSTQRNSTRNNPTVSYADTARRIIIHLASMNSTTSNLKLPTKKEATEIAKGLSHIIRMPHWAPTPSAHLSARQRIQSKKGLYLPHPSISDKNNAGPRMWENYLKTIPLYAWRKIPGIKRSLTARRNKAVQDKMIRDCKMLAKLLPLKNQCQVLAKKGVLGSFGAAFGKI